MLLLYCAASPSYALPPVGLTLIDSASQPNPFGIDLSVIDGNAYVSAYTGVWVVDSTANSTFVPILHSQFGAPDGYYGVTQVTKALNNQLYLAANYELPFPTPSGALFRLDQPAIEIVTWPTAYDLVGVDQNLRTLGNDYGQFVAEYLVDGSVNALGVPAGCTFAECASSQFLIDVSEGGFASGVVPNPNTPSAGIGVWDPSGSVTTIQIYDIAGKIADRLDGNGYNLSLSNIASDNRIKLGDLFFELTQDVQGNTLSGEGGILVSQSNFALLQENFFRDKKFYGFYPGIVPGNPQAAVNLFEIFPELSTIDVDGVSDMYAVGHRIYMTVYGDDGLYLFGALDPSNVPEPAAAILLLTALPWLARRPQPLAA